MTLQTSGRDPNLVRATVPEGKLEWLGRGPDGNDYAIHNRREYLVEPGSSYPEDYSRLEGEILVMRVAHEMIDGSRLEHHRTHRGIPVPAGTFAAMVARVADRKAKLEAKPKPRPLDGLADHPFLARRPDGILPIAEPPAGYFAALLSKTPTAIRLPGRERRQGVAAILAVLQERGITLHLSPAGTMYALGARITTPARSLIEQAAPLLHAHLRGQPLRCEFQHPEQAPEAVTLLVGGAAVCDQHLSEVEA